MSSRRENPARLAEQVALGVVRHWLGDGGVIEDRTETGEPDFRVSYSDGRQAVGEVTLDEDPTLAAMWAFVFREFETQQLPLAAGVGTWSVRVRDGAKLKGLAKRIEPLLVGLNQANVSAFDPDYAAPRHPLVALSRKLGVRQRQLVPRMPGVLDRLPGARHERRLLPVRGSRRLSAGYTARSRAGSSVLSSADL